MQMEIAVTCVLARADQSFVLQAATLLAAESLDPCCIALMNVVINPAVQSLLPVDLFWRSNDSVTDCFYGS